MLHKFHTSLNFEELKDILKRRANSRNIKIAFKYNRLIIKNCKIRMSGIDYHVPFIAKITI